MSRSPRTFPSAIPDSPPPWLGWALIVAAVFVAYFPALHANFIWNDSEHITAPALRSLSGLRRIWFELGATEQYYPFLHSAFWLQHRWWGDAPTGYHLVNLLLHAGSAGLFATVLRRLAVPGVWLAALVFALHPVCVESVAWVSELKNTLSTAFYLAAALAYLRFDRHRSPRAYALAFAFFLLALLSKSVTASLPAALLVVFWWQRGRLEARRDVVPLVPLFIVGAAMGLFTAWVEVRYIGAHGSDFTLGALARGLLAGRIVWFYLGKLLWPAELIFIYPRWHIDPTLLRAWLFPLAAIGLFAGVWAIRRKTRAPAAVFLLFAGTLFPVLGFFNVYPFRFSFVADHFQYLACLGPIALAGAGFSTAFSRSAWSRTAGCILPVALLGVLGALTWRQATLYRDMETFYRLTLARNPAAWMAQNNLGNMLLADGRTDEAVARLETAVALKPDFAETQSNLGTALAQAGRAAEAVVHYQAALQLEPNHAGFAYNLALALRQQGKTAAALAHLQTLVQAQPQYADAWDALALCELDTGQLPAALAHFETAVRLQPARVETLNHLAGALLAAGRPDEAFRRLDQALAAQPDSSETHTNYAIGLAQSRRLDEALVHFRAAARLRPDAPELQVNLAIVLVQAGRLEEAVAAFSEALRLNPTDADTHAKLGTVLQQLGRTEQAAIHFARAQSLTSGLSKPGMGR